MIALDQERCTCELCRHHYTTQQEMAAIVGSAREVVGRMLHEFQSAGIIELHNGHVVVHDSARLQKMAGDEVNTRSRTQRISTAAENDQYDQHDQRSQSVLPTARRLTASESRKRSGH